MLKYHKSSVKRSILSLMIIAFFGFLVSFTLFLTERNEWSKAIENRFQNLALTTVSAFQRELNALFRELDGVRRFFEGSVFVDRTEFHKYTESIILHYPEIQAIGWIPLVSAENYKEHEAAARTDGLTDYKINPGDFSEEMIQETDSDVFFPIYYIEPKSGNELYIGFNMASNPEWFALLEKVHKNGKPIMSESIAIVQENIEGYYYYEFVPFYRKELLGFVLGISRIPDMFSVALESFDFSYFNITLNDLSPGMDSSILYSSHVITEKQGESADNSYVELQYESNFMAGGRPWSLLVTAQPEFYADSGADKQWIVLISGLFITALFSLLVYILQARTARVEVLVEEQTKELRNSEGRLRAITEGSPAFILMMDREGKYH